MLLIGNPTRTAGEFYDSHEHPRKKQVYHRITISSRETPNAVERRNIIPGLATHYWIEQEVAKYGEDSAFVKVRINGEFPVGEDGKAFSIALITESEKRWEEIESDGDLQIGIDPAGSSGTGDETAMSARRGNKQLALRRWRGLNEQAHGAHLLGLIEELREYPRERATVVIDCEGKVGWDTYTYLMGMASQRGSTFDLYRVRASDKAFRQPMTFDRVRDELADALHDWMKDGGAILKDEQLETELHALEWEPGPAGRQKITPKKVLRKLLGRSPDSYDATALSVWPVLSKAVMEEDDGDDDDFDDDDYGVIIDPYGDMANIFLALKQRMCIINSATLRTRKENNNKINYAPKLCRCRSHKPFGSHGFGAFAYSAGKAWLGKARPGTARLGAARQADHGEARQAWRAGA
jgi:hypothetical protein